ncbi:MAG: hypothetical protein AAF560_01535 [Acidobacteriota bacterium]
MRKPVVAFTFIFYLLSFAAALSAQPVEEVHEFHIYPNVESTPLKLHWLTVEQNSRLVVVAPPSLGTLEAGRYTPVPEFWRTGVDRVSLKEAGMVNSPVYTLLLTALVPDYHIAQIEMSFANFEECLNPNCIPVWWDDLDPLDLLSVNGNSALSGERSLSFQIPHNGGVGRVKEDIDPYGGGGGTGAGGSGTHQVEPPDYNYQNATAVIASLGELEIQVRMPDRMRPGSGASELSGYQMRIAAPNNQFCVTCATPWRLMPFSHPIHTEVWAGDKVTGPDETVPRPRGLRFTVQVDGQQATVDRLEGYFDAWGLELGVLRANGIEGLSGQYDDFETWREIYFHRPLGKIADGFEGGGHGSWVFDGPVAITSDAAISGKAGAEIELAPLINHRSEHDHALLIDQTPIAAHALTAMMRVDLSDLNVADGTTMQILRASADDTVDSFLRVALVLQRWGYQYRVQLVAIDDHRHDPHVTPWVVLANEETDLVVQWRSAEPGRDNGEMRLWSKGALVAEKRGMSNGTQRIESVAYGVHDLLVPERSIGLGTINIDDVASFSNR